MLHFQIRELNPITMIWKVVVANDANEDSDETAPCAFSITFYFIFFLYRAFTNILFNFLRRIGNNFFNTKNKYALVQMFFNQKKLLYLLRLFAYYFCQKNFEISFYTVMYTFYLFNNNSFNLLILDLYSLKTLFNSEQIQLYYHINEIQIWIKAQLCMFRFLSF